MKDLLSRVKREITSGEEIIAGPFMLAPYPCKDGAAPEEPRNPCAALVFKTETHIGVKFAAAGRLPKNGARRDNEQTWITGDVIEFFIQPEGREDYYEFHATPEGFRLQLNLPHYTVFREFSFEEKIRDCGLVVKTLELAQDLWVGEMRIPLAKLQKGQWAEIEGQWVRKNSTFSIKPSAFRFCVSRYCYATTDKPELSCHPPLPAPQGYHNPPFWAEVG